MRFISPSLNNGNRPASSNAKLPLSTINPPSVVPWPHRYFVAEYVEMSAPRAFGRQIKGVVVLSTITGIPRRSPISTSAGTGNGTRHGLENVSPNMAIVLSSNIRSNDVTSLGSADRASIPNRLNVLKSRFHVLPYRYFDTTTLSPGVPLHRLAIARKVADCRELPPWRRSHPPLGHQKKVTHRSRLYSDGSSKVPTVGRARRFAPLQPCTRLAHDNP